MNENDVKSLIAIFIIIIIAIFLAFFGSQGGTTVYAIPVFALAIIISFVIQWIAFIPAYIKKTEKYFDLTGSITYSTVIQLPVFVQSY